MKIVILILIFIIVKCLSLCYRIIKMNKVLVIGDMNTGKTSLMHRAVNNTYSTTYKATIACEFGTKITEVHG